VSALEGRGMDAVWRIVEEHRATLGATGELARKRREQQQAWFWSMIDDGLKRHFLAREDVRRLLPEMEEAVQGGRLTPTEAARRLLALLDEGPGTRTRSAPPSRRTKSA
jgi:GTPase